MSIKIMYVVELEGLGNSVIIGRKIRVFYDLYLLEDVSEIEDMKEQ